MLPILYDEKNMFDVVSMVLLCWLYIVKDFFVRISSPDGAAQYNSTKPSIILFHRAVGNTGHYESIQTDEPGEKFGRGIFVHK